MTDCFTIEGGYYVSPLGQFLNCSAKREIKTAKALRIGFRISISNNIILRIQIQSNSYLNFLVDNFSSQRCPGAPGASQLKAMTISSDIGKLQELGSLHHPRSCRRIQMTAAPAATFSVPSIKIPSKCAIFLSLSPILQVNTSHIIPVYASVKTPG